MNFMIYKSIVLIIISKEQIIDKYNIGKIITNNCIKYNSNNYKY